MLLTYNGGTIDAADEVSARLLANGWQRVKPKADQEPTQDLSALTVARLRELCGERGIQAPKRATKAQLLELLEG